MEEYAPLKQYVQARVQSRSLDELIGLARGLAADGRIIKAEAEFLQHWLRQTTALAEDPVYRILYARVNEMLADGQLHDDESAELLEMLHTLTGDHGELKAFRSPTRLPLDDPMPTIDFPDRTFLFTGIMAFGPRSECQLLITDRGGACKSSMSKKVDYLVIGTIANEEWMYSSHGRKIEQALALKDSGHPVIIVDEDHFMKHVFI
ncbi:BRCT domain-containing protein [Vreelandella sp. EE7]